VAEKNNDRKERFKYVYYLSVVKFCDNMGQLQYMLIIGEGDSEMGAIVSKLTAPETYLPKCEDPRPQNISLTNEEPEEFEVTACKTGYDLECIAMEYRPGHFTDLSIAEGHSLDQYSLLIWAQAHLSNPNDGRTTSVEIPLTIDFKRKKARLKVATCTLATLTDEDSQETTQVYIGEMQRRLQSIGITIEAENTFYKIVATASESVLAGFEVLRQKRQK
jgi:hypothetical protein